MPPSVRYPDAERLDLASQLADIDLNEILWPVGTAHRWRSILAPYRLLNHLDRHPAGEGIEDLTQDLELDRLQRNLDLAPRCRAVTFGQHELEWIVELASASRTASGKG